MNTYTLHRRQLVPRPVEEVFAFFADAGNLDLLTPSWMHFRIITPQPIALHAGAKIEYALRWHHLPLRWLTEILEWSPPTRFVDTQTRGPYRLWHHTHAFTPADGGTVMEDTVRYALPFGVLGRLAHSLGVRRDIETIFDFRFKRIAELFP
jgi:ligand-binding SRPBCC domain-containing protein